VLRYLDVTSLDDDVHAFSLMVSGSAGVPPLGGPPRPPVPSIATPASALAGT
jgi:hypothetical protein